MIFLNSADKIVVIRNLNTHTHTHTHTYSVSEMPYIVKLGLDGCGSYQPD